MADYVDEGLRKIGITISKPMLAIICIVLRARLNVSGMRIVRKVCKKWGKRGSKNLMDLMDWISNDLSMNFETTNDDHKITLCYKLIGYNMLERSR